MTGVLDGIRVIEVAGMAACPSAAVMLADLGAEVIKVEPPSGDMWRMGHMVKGMPPSDVPYTTFMQNRTKKSVALNLKDPSAQEVLHKLAASADVFLTNSPRKVQRECAHTYDVIKEIKPDIVYAWINGFGMAGPDTDAPGFDMTAYYSRTGTADELSPKGSGPSAPPVGFGDLATAIALCNAVMTGLFHKERTGKGSFVATSLMNVGLWQNSTFVQAALVGAPPMQKFHRTEWPNPVNGGFFKTSDDRYVQIVELNPNNFANLCDAFGASEAKDDPRFATPKARDENSAELFAAMDRIVGQHDLATVKARLKEYHVNFSPVQTTAEDVTDEHMIANGCFPEVEGAGGHKTVDSPIYVEGEGIGKVPPRKAPEVGEHTASIMANLGYSEDQIKEMAESKAIRVHG